MSKQWIEPEKADFKDLSPKNCVPSPSDGTGFKTSVMKGNHIHHTFVSPNNKEGRLELTFPIGRQSAINVGSSEDGAKGKSWGFHRDIFPDYTRWYQAVTREIDNILAHVRKETSPDELRAQLFAEMKKRRPGALTDEAIEALYKTNVRSQTFSAELFRQVASGLLIQSHMESDAAGTAIVDACNGLVADYAAWIDKNPALREKIYGIISLPDTEWETRAVSSLIVNPVQNERYDATHPTLSRLINYAKSPTIKIKLYYGVPKDDKKKASDIVISETNQVLFTAVWDMTERKLGPAAPISTRAEFERFTYTAGDGKKGNKKPFKLLSQVKCMAPTAYWSEAKKSCTFQFTATNVEMYDFITLVGMGRTLSVDKVHEKLEAVRKVRQALGLEEDATEFDFADDDLSNGGGDLFAQLDAHSSKRGANEFTRDQLGHASPDKRIRYDAH